jgi:hypothetical protein
VSLCSSQLYDSMVLMFPRRLPEVESFFPVIALVRYWKYGSRRGRCLYSSIQDYDTTHHGYDGQVGHVPSSLNSTDRLELEK